MKKTACDFLVIAFSFFFLHCSCFAQIDYFTWDVANGGNGHRYGITTHAGDWATIQDLAIAEGGTLATITSQGEQNFVEAVFGLSDTFEPFWLGATDLGVEGVFEWVTNETFSYDNWKTGEPNNNGGDEHFLTINWESVRGNPGTWNDTSLFGTIGFDAGVNDGPYRGIVELNAVPEPTTCGLCLVGSFAFFLKRSNRITR